MSQSKLAFIILIVNIWLAASEAIVQGRRSHQPSAITAKRVRQEDDIREAVLRQLFARYGRQGPHQIYFASIADKDPSDTFLKRFEHNNPAVVKASRAGQDANDRSGLHDKLLGIKGTLFNIQNIHWISNRQVKVGWYWRYFRRAGMGAAFRVIKADGHWKVGEIVGPVYKN